MTCFWSGILSSLNTDDFNYINEPSKPNIKNFIELLKRNNIDTKNVLWQNTKLTPKQLEENKEHIRDFNIENINSGYLCSICDPFLLLIACIFKVNIEPLEQLGKRFKISFIITMHHILNTFY